MRCYFAVSGHLVQPGKFADLCKWAEHRISAKKAKIVKIIKARPNEKTGRIVFEITADGIFPTPHGRSVLLHTLKKSVCPDG